MDYDVTTLLGEQLAKSRRPPDGLLHPSSDLIGPLRHTMLKAAGAPTIESKLISDVRLMTGTMWHTFFESAFRGKPGMFEVNLTPWLPEGWSGTADWLLWDDDYKAFVLKDLKTIKGEGINYIIYDGVKEEHLWQGSAYWHAAAKMGIPLLDRFYVYYLPMNIPSDKPDIEPQMVEVAPLPADIVEARMTERWEATYRYLTAQRHAFPGCDMSCCLECYLDDTLAPESERVQGLRYNKTQGVYDLKLLPHWATTYCPFPDELCNCNNQKTEKIGHYAAWAGDIGYVPRKGYEDIAPTVKLTKTQERKLYGN